ncbi:MAG: type II secretion system protein [Phycisphaeraceae bacterium]
MKPRGFTLVEMLLVVAIIVLLISMLLPSLAASREAARDVVCRTQIAQVGSAMRSLGTDNWQRLPGLWGPPWTGSDPLEGSFMGKEVFTGSFQPTPAAKNGTLVTYIGGESSARQFYRCPAQPQGVFGSGVGSNGLFDVTMIQALPGARINHVPSNAQYVAGGPPVTVPLPVIIEEDPAYGINKQFIDMGHTSINRFAMTHFRTGGNYVAIDLSAHGLRFPTDLGPQGYDWSTTTSNGTPVSLGTAKNYGMFGK